MPQRRILYLTQHQLAAFRWQAGRLTHEGDFAPEEAGERFLNYLKQHAQSLFSLVTNLAEEGFQQETIPFVQGRDREAIVQRKLSQTFMGASLSVAVPLGHEKNTRRNERLLLMALTSSATLEPWLLALRATESRLVGIYSLPLLTDSIFAALKLPKARSLFVTVQDNTVRQSFIDQGRLVFSRLAPITNSSIGGMAQNVVSEIIRLQQYLQTQRLIQRNETIDVHLLLHTTAHAALSPDLLPPTLRLQSIELGAAAKALGFHDVLPDSRAQALYLHTAAQHPPRQQFAPLLLRKPYRIWQIGNVLKAVGIIGFMSCALYAGKQYLDAVNVELKTKQLELAASEKAARYQRMLATFPPMPMDNDQLRQIVDRIQTLQQSDHLPDTLLRPLAAALDASPSIELIELEWDRHSAKAVDRNTGNASGGTPTPGKETRPTLKIKASLSPGRQTDPRQIIDALEQFTQHLKDIKGVEVRVLKQPFDVGSGSALKSDSGPDSSTKPREFELRLTTTGGGQS